jgi:hypothetical protein
MITRCRGKPTRRLRSVSCPASAATTRIPLPARSSLRTEQPGLPSSALSATKRFPYRQKGPEEQDALPADIESVLIRQNSAMYRVCRGPLTAAGVVIPERSTGFRASCSGSA